LILGTHRRLRYLSKNGVDSVQSFVFCSLSTMKELTAAGFFCVRHRQRATSCLCGLPRSRSRSCSRVRPVPTGPLACSALRIRIAALDHEILDDAVKTCSGRKKTELPAFRNWPQSSGFLLVELGLSSSLFVSIVAIFHSSVGSDGGVDGEIIDKSGCSKPNVRS